MGLLDVLNGMQNGPGGGQPAGRSSGGMSPLMIAMMGLLAYKAFKGATAQQPGAAPAAPTAPASGGGLGDLLRGGLGSLMGGQQPGAGPAAGGGLGGGLGGLLGGLLAGGAAGSVVSGGLGDLLKQFQQAGQSDVAHSWVGNGPNQSISPDDLAKALGSDQINTLAEQSGLSPDELLSGLSQHLPEFINKLTPNGRLPAAHEL